MNKNVIKNGSEAVPVTDAENASYDINEKVTLDESHLLRESGIVSSIEGEFAYIDAQRQSGCSGCSSSSGCGTSALATLFTNATQSAIKVKNTLDVQVGDHVVLTLDESRLIKHSFMAYGVPLIGLFLFAIIFARLSVYALDASETGADIAAIVGGFMGLASGWWLTHKIYQPVLPEMSRPERHK